MNIEAESEARWVFQLRILVLILDQHRNYTNLVFREGKLQFVKFIVHGPQVGGELIAFSEDDYLVPAWGYLFLLVEAGAAIVGAFL